MIQTWKHYGKMMLAVAGLLLAVSPAAFATDGKVYPGLDCVEASPGSSTQNWTNGAIVNNVSTYMATVHCPAIRDNVGGHWERVTVRVDDRNTSADISCTFRILTDAGGTDYFRTAKSAGTGIQTLTFNGTVCGNSCIGPRHTRTPYLLTCNLPAKQTGVVDGWSKVLYYAMDEQ
jgi:hypothetical protein